MKNLALPKLCLLSLLLFVVTACAQAEEVDGEETPTTTATAAAVATATLRATATATIMSTATATALPSPEPPVPAVAVVDQVLGSDGQIVIQRIVITEPGWLVIRSDEDGQPGEVVGLELLSEGELEELLIEVETLQASPTLYALLHTDAGQAGVFEFPGPDGPVLHESDPVMATFGVELQLIRPAVTVSDQELNEEGLITIDEVVSPGPGWIVLHVDTEGGPGPMLGYAPVKEGENDGIVIDVNWRQATPTLHAALYADAGTPDQFEPPGIDLPIVIEGSPIVTTFKASLPPDIFVLDQPVIDETIVAERAISYGPGWLVAYADNEGALGNVIGWAALEDGVNEQIRVPVAITALTPLLHLMIHEDLETVAEFGFPRTDPPVMNQGRLPRPFSFRTDITNYLITRDQTLSTDNVVTVPLLVIDEDGWAVVWTDAEGELGEIIGLTWVPAGINRDVTVEIDPELLTSTLHVGLHLDSGTPKEFEFPDGVDLPLQRNRSLIHSPFTLLPAAGDA